MLVSLGMSSVICWFHNDLRLADHPALVAAIESGQAVIPLYIHDEVAPKQWRVKGAAKLGLDMALRNLDASLRGLGSRLITARVSSSTHASAESVFTHLIQHLKNSTPITAVYCHRHYEPWAVARQKRVGQALAKLGVDFECVPTPATLLIQPNSIHTKSHTRFQVFTAFKKTLVAQRVHWWRTPLPPPKSLPPIPQNLATLTSISSIDDLGLTQPVMPWHRQIYNHWQIGEEAAHKQLKTFIATGLAGYGTRRDFMSEAGTSSLSPQLRFGTLSPMQIVGQILGQIGGKTGGQISHAAVDGSGGAWPEEGTGAEKFVSEVIWREFNYELLDQYPHLPNTPIKQEFTQFPWRSKADYHPDLVAWQKGLTGYPLVDAGMRQLYATGWMHNRVRMITASVLTKHLLIPWQEGAAWFFDTLLDADLASNSGNWQWVAGCGADAVPYFRIFNPISQINKFKAYDYIRQWLPELASLPDAILLAPPTRENYPPPLINHDKARGRALDSLKIMRSKASKQ
ncbi:MAG: DNA photolyase family protein [Proteobacteria bacterium]|nr:DNA photolyase family protein [Pseudomonadota bacterium]